MSDLENLCGALERSVQPLPASADALRQRSLRLRSLAAEVQQARSRVRCACGPDVGRVVQALHEAAGATAASAQSLLAATQQSRSFVARTIAGGGHHTEVAGAIGAVAVTGAGASDEATEMGWLDGGTHVKELIDVGAADYSDNPILDGFTRGGLCRADYDWAVEAWDTAIRPGLEAGMSRSDFEAIDKERGAPPLRRTAGVYDFFLGDDPIVVERSVDGTYAVTSGRHRIEAARGLGVSVLPMRVL